VITVTVSDPLWLLVAVLAVLPLGAVRVNAEANQRLAEPKAAQADRLQKRNTELAQLYALSQEQSKVLGQFSREHPPGRI
jgi:hypothetical protein